MEPCGTGRGTVGLFLASLPCSDVWGKGTHPRVPCEVTPASYVLCGDRTDLGAKARPGKLGLSPGPGPDSGKVSSYSDLEHGCNDFTLSAVARAKRGWRPARGQLCGT